jgi:hypothetical protein
MFRCSWNPNTAAALWMVGIAGVLFVAGPVMYALGNDLDLKPWKFPVHTSLVSAVPESHHTRPTFVLNCAMTRANDSSCLEYGFTPGKDAHLVQFRILASTQRWIPQPSACNMSADFKDYPIIRGSGDVVVYDLVHTGQGVCLPGPSRREKTLAWSGVVLLILVASVFAGCVLVFEKLDYRLYEGNEHNDRHAERYILSGVTTAT